MTKTKNNGAGSLEDLVKDLPSEQIDKLAEIIAVAQKINGEQSRVLEKNEVVKTADQIKKDLPQNPRGIVFNILRKNIERKIEKQGKKADKYKADITKLKEKSQKILRKIDKLSEKISRREKANEFLEGLKGFGFIKKFLVKSNKKNIARQEKKLAAFGRKISENNSKIKDAREKLKGRNAAIDKLSEKIHKIDEIQHYPKAVLVYFLSEMHEAKATAQFVPLPTACEFNQAEPETPMINFAEIDIEQDPGERKREREHDEKELAEVEYEQAEIE